MKIRLVGCAAGFVDVAADIRSSKSAGGGYCWVG